MTPAVAGRRCGVVTDVSPIIASIVTNVVESSQCGPGLPSRSLQRN